MTTSSAVSAWLPSSALTPHHFEAEMTRIVSEWGERWFVQRRPNARIGLRDMMTKDSERLEWLCLDDGLALGVDRAGKLAVVEAMVGRALPPASLKPADEPLLMSLATTCLDDLLRKLAIAAASKLDGIGPARPDSCAMTWEVGLQKANGTIRLAVTRDALVRWRKAKCGPTDRIALTSRADGLNRQDVSVSFALGHGTANLSSVRDLEIGDVILLDGRQQDHSRLSIGDRASEIRGRVSAAGDKTILTIAKMGNS